MFSLQVQTSFSAAHAIIIKGILEPVHGHDWHVTAEFTGETLDAEGMLIDFHLVEQALHAAVAPWKNQFLNVCPPFGKQPNPKLAPTAQDLTLNPTAEHVAREIASRISQTLQSRGAIGPKSSVRLASVAVTEAVGCRAIYTLPRG